MSKRGLVLGLESFLQVCFGLGNNSSCSCPGMPPLLHSSKSGLAGLRQHGDGFLDSRATVEGKNKEQPCAIFTNYISMRL